MKRTFRHNLDWARVVGPERCVLCIELEASFRVHGMASWSQEFEYTVCFECKDALVKRLKRAAIPCRVIPIYARA